MIATSPQPQPPYSDPREAILDTINQSKPGPLYEQTIDVDDVELLSQRQVPNLVGPHAGELLTVLSCLAIIRNIQLPVWQHPTPAREPDLADASWTKGYISGCFMMESTDGGKRWQRISASVGTMHGVPPGPLHGQVCINPGLGVGIGGIVYNSQVERLEIELEDGTLYSDTVKERVLHIFAPLQNDTQRNGEFTSRLFARSGELIERTTFPANPMPPSNLLK